jgi:hypothetical protein
MDVGLHADYEFGQLACGRVRGARNIFWQNEFNTTHLRLTPACSPRPNRCLPRGRLRSSRRGGR